MYSSVQLAKKYLYHYRNAANSKGHGMHSPFVYDFIIHVLQDGAKSSYQEAIETLRYTLLKDKTSITIQDLGAGSRKQASNQKTICQIAKTAVKPIKCSRFLYRLVAHYKPQSIIELGTSLGISTAYMAAASPNATIYTIEGSPKIQQYASKGFAALGMGFIKSLTGSFDAILPAVLENMDTIDLAYIDGNHRLQPTLHYFELLLAKKTDQSIFVFDDIHWSIEMETAWDEIKKHEAVRYTIDLFFFGLVFFRPEFKVKQHFAIRF